MGPLLKALPFQLAGSSGERLSLSNSMLWVCFLLQRNEGAPWEVGRLQRD